MDGRALERLVVGQGLEYSEGKSLSLGWMEKEVTLGAHEDPRAHLTDRS